MRKNPIDAQTASDLKAIGTSIGMITQNGVSLVGNAFQSNWGIYIGPSGSYDGLGGGVAVGFNVDTFPQQNGKFNMAITIPFEPQDAANGSFSAGYTEVVYKGQF